VQWAAVVWMGLLFVSIIGIGTSSNLLAQERPQQGPTAPKTPNPESPTSGPESAPPQAASISGTVVDQSGALVANVRITLSQPGLGEKSADPKTVAVSDNNGRFAFAGVVPGPFHLALAAAGFADQEMTGAVHAGEDYVIPQIALAVARADVDVEVRLPSEQVAEDQVKVEEQQRLLGVIPNYYVSYVPHAAPLTPRLKFQLAWKTTFDPVSLAITGAIAGIEQADNAYSGYGQGAAGYGKRFGAAYGDFISGTFIGGAILPSLLKQDPRYFWKGSGSKSSRFFYAVANAVICKGDNGHWQANYSGIIGGLAAGGISNLYYPAENRNGAALTFENAAIGTGFGAVGNVIQEFFLRKFTPHVPPQNAGKDVEPAALPALPSRASAP
jgi:hypothetical protein